MSAPKPFPQISLEHTGTGADANPGVQLFGRRFFIDQTILEYLAEFLLVVNSKKQIGSEGNLFDTKLPSWEQLQNWEDGKLGYQAPLRLSFKLFSFLGTSKLETRHQSHKQQYTVILKKISEAIQTGSAINKEQVLEDLGNLFLGFQGVGFNRTWCAQTFIPITNSFLANETLWNDTTARRESTHLDWQDITTKYKKFFSVSRHRFMARGGELLYLQLCNALRTKHSEFANFISQFDFSEDEKNPQKLYESLQVNLEKITNQCPPTLDKIANLIDTIDGTTTVNTSTSAEMTWCAWCPEDSWKEGYLFAIELNRLCQAAIDPIERIELLMLGCSLQVLRSLSAQSVRYANKNEELKSFGGSLGYSWVVASSQGKDRSVKHLSQRNLQIILRTIQQALRQEDIYEKTGYSSKSIDALYNEADNRYGHKMFLSLAKKLGFVVPIRGPGARFILNDKLLRYFLLALVKPGERITYDKFKALLYSHYGIAVEGDELNKANKWSELPQVDSSGTESGKWLAEMLMASGFLIHLSDACSLVHNPFILNKNEDPV